MATPAALALATGDSAAGDCTVVVALALTVAELVVVTGAEVLVRADAADVVGAPELVPRLLLAVPDAAELAVTASAAVLLWGVLVPAVPPQAAIKGTAARVVTALSAWTTNAAPTGESEPDCHGRPLRRLQRHRNPAADSEEYGSVPYHPYLSI